MCSMFSERGTAHRLLLGLLAGTTVLRLCLGWFYFGFLTGDDVEILEAGFRAIGLQYAPWDLRNTLISDLLVGPLLVAARGLGISDVRSLVWVASWPFVLCATLNIYLLFRLVQRWSSQDSVALCAAALYGLHWIPLGFGSMTYPRGVSTTCVLAAALLVSSTRRIALRELLAGALIALAFGFRYSEAIFLAPVAWIAASSKESWRARGASLLRVGGGFVLGVLLVAGVYESWTWGKPFAALIAFARYTLVEKQASALVALQPPYWYLWRLAHWWCPAALPLACYSLRRRQLPPAWLFVALPLVLLSYIHHKELRYLQGILPFVCAASAAGAVKLRENGWRRTTAALLLLTAGWGLVRVRFLEDKSMPSVLAARALAGDASVRTFAGVQIWGYGDKLYFGNERLVRDIPFPTAPVDVERLAPGADAVGLYAQDLARNPQLETVLEHLGFCGWRDFSFRGSKAVRLFRPCGRTSFRRRRGGDLPVTRPEAVDGHQHDADRDGAVGNVERGPVMGSHVDVDEVGDGAAGHAVDEVAHRASHHQGQGHQQPAVARRREPEVEGHGSQGAEAEDGEQPAAAAVGGEEAKSHAGVAHVSQVEAGDHRLRHVVGKVELHQPFRPLVEDDHADGDQQVAQLAPAVFKAGSDIVGFHSCLSLQAVKSRFAEMLAGGSHHRTQIGCPLKQPDRRHSRRSRCGQLPESL
jgi:glycosyl transferase family 22 (putative mannosyltransferase)